jgi:hypothetical protein
MFRYFPAIFKVALDKKKLLEHVGGRGADKSLVRPGRKRATATEDFDVHISYL